jgi:hypothetical protein
MQQHACKAIPCYRNNLYPVTASVLTPPGTHTLKLIAAYFVDMLSLGGTNVGAQKNTKHSLFRRDTRSVGCMQYTAMVLFLHLCHVTFPGQPGTILGFSLN